MQIRLVLSSSPQDLPRPVLVAIEELGAPTVGDVLGTVGLPLGPVQVDGRPIDPADAAVDVLVDGAVIARWPGESGATAAPLVIGLAVVAGPDAGGVTLLGAGSHVVGRDLATDVAIEDRTVSRRHLQVQLEDGSISAADLGSVNGSWVSDAWIGAATPVAPKALMHIGASSLRLHPLGSSAPPVGAPRGGRIAFVRPPRHQLPAALLIAPPPRAQGVSRRMALDVVAIAVPVLFALLMAVMFDPRFALMGLIGPVLALNNHYGQRRRGRRDDAQREITDRQARTRFRNDVLAAKAAHIRDLHERTPDLGEIARRIDCSLDGLWERRPAHDDFLALSVGFASIAWAPEFTGDARDIDDIARALLDEHRSIDDAPITIDARQPIGIRGEAAETLALARALTVQAAALHGPADLRIVVATTEARRAKWAWAEWLPHTHEPRLDTRLVVGDEAALRDLVEQLLGAEPDDEIERTFVVVDDASLVANRATPVRQLLAGLRGATAIVIASSVAPIPSLCHTVVDVSTDMVVTVTVPARASVLRGVRGSGLSEATAARLAARMARFADPEASAAAASLPPQVTLLQLLTGTVDAAAINARWDASRMAASFVVPIGIDSEGPLMIDLVHDGPHILVAGTTGSGKSELLRTLITSLAATVDTDRVNFLLVDYKGGSAFDRCASLPHTVGVVTDLDGRLTARAFTCLEAELRRRERALRDAGVDDISGYHRRQAHGALRPLPRLVVVVDEFAALVSELPQFVDALIDIGQRGRSLGVHIVLATQRPSGVVKDALRANTNLRISLRVLDQNDSRDVLGVVTAAQISRRHPGRAIARMGAAELITFQAASVTARTLSSATESVHLVDSTPAPVLDEHGPTDLARLVDAIVGAHLESGRDDAWRPWPDPLPTHVALDEVEGAIGRTVDEGVVFGLADLPHEQRHEVARWLPANGPLMVQSLRGGGATTALATIALDVARCHAPDRAHLYVLDLGAGELAPLANLVHCGAYIAAHETERITRLLRLLTDELKSRKAATATDRAGRPMIVVIVDSVAVLAQAGEPDAHRDALRQLIGDGAAVDIHLALSTDRAGALGHATEGLIAQRVLLRMAEAADYSMIGVRGVDPSQLPPGRGFLAPGGTEIQVALPGRTGLAAAVAAIRRPGGPRSARPIAVLPDVVSLIDVVAEDKPTEGWIVGMLDRTLGPAVLALAPGDHALIAGPARSGKSSTLALIARAAQRDGTVVHVLASSRSPLLHDRSLPDALTTEALATLVDALIEAPPMDDHLFVVDDADLVDEGGHLERLLATRPLNVHIVATARADRLRAAFRHWTTEVRRSRVGILLRPDDIDGELLGVRLQRGTLPPISGRGYLVTEHGTEIVQVAALDAHGHAA
ncbi:MAG: FtsK/SpoIIIE domain-containing protein [Acidimicrobiales bacterium]